MRTLFLLLVLVNLGFFAYARVARDSGATSQISQLEVSPEKIKVLKAASKSGLDRPRSDKGGKAGSQGAAAAPAACLEWGIFAGPDVARADAALARAALPQDRIKRTVTD